MTTKTTAQQFIDQIIPHKTPKKLGFGEAPVNIALSKYWGKRDVELNLPTNSSLSISLPGLGTKTYIEKNKLTEDIITLNKQLLSKESPFAKRLSLFLNYFRASPTQFFNITTENSVPTAAGLASSASGYAALVLALNDCFEWNLPDPKLSLLARLGSGSASRSLYKGFAIWHKGTANNGLDSYAEPIKTSWAEFCVGLVEVDISEKKMGSTQGMQNTVETCELYSAWPQKAEQDLLKIKQAIEQKNFKLLGKTAENNALSMHATMIATWPPILYWQAASVTAMQQVWQLRDKGIEIYFTMDAGPNLKLLFLASDIIEIKKMFGEISIIQPFKDLH